MGDARAVVDEPPDRGLRPRRATRRRGDHHPRPLPITGVRVYTAAGCHLCEAAIEVIEGVRGEVPFELELVDVSGDPALEREYRELLPVVDIDGERAFTWFVDPAALRERLLEARGAST